MPILREEERFTPEDNASEHTHSFGPKALLSALIWRQTQELSFREACYAGVSSSCGARGGFLPRHDEDLRPL